MDFKVKRKYYNLCDPQESLGPSDPRNVDIDNLDTGLARGINWVDRLANKIEFSEKPVLRVLPPDAHAFRSIRTNLYNQTRMLIQGDDFRWLAKVAHTRFFTPDNDAHRLSADRMLTNNVLLCYQNSDIWYDLHPAAYEIPGIQHALRALQEGEE